MLVRNQITFVLGRLFFLFFPSPFLFKKLLGPSGLNSKKLPFFLSLFFNTLCLWKCWKWVEGKRRCVSEGEMDLRDVRHAMTRSDAFLIKSGFPPATGAQIKGVGGGRWHCCREVLSGLVTRVQQQRRHVFLTRCDVRLHSGKHDFPPCRLLLSFLPASLSWVALQPADIFERFTILFYILSSIGD